MLCSCLVCGMKKWFAQYDLVILILGLLCSPRYGIGFVCHGPSRVLAYSTARPFETNNSFCRCFCAYTAHTHTNTRRRMKIHTLSTLLRVAMHSYTHSISHSVFVCASNGNKASPKKTNGQMYPNWNMRNNRNDANEDKQSREYYTILLQNSEAKTPLLCRCWSIAYLLKE